MANTETTPFVYTISEVLEIIRRKIQEYDINLKEPYFLAVRGVLGSVSPTRYSVHYKVPFKDTEGNVIAVDIPKSLGEIIAYQQKEVIIYGFLKSNIYNSTLSLSIHTTRIQPVVEISLEVKEQEATLMDLLSSHQRDIKPFPDIESYRISVIHGMSSEVKADFERQLKPDQETFFKITYIPVNITSAAILKKIVEAAEADIMVVIRGGGSDGEFEVFNDYELVKEWVSKDAYKIAALGHTRHRTLFDTFASQSCDNPTDAGAFIRKNIDSLKALKKLEEAANKHKKEMEEAHKEFAKKQVDLHATHMKKIEELQKEKETAVKEAQAKSEAAQKELAGRNETLQKEKDAAGKEYQEKILALQKSFQENMSKLESAKEKAIAKSEDEANAAIEALRKQLKTANTRLIIAVVVFVIMLAVVLYLGRYS